MLTTGFAKASSGYAELQCPSSERSLLACLAHQYEIAASGDLTDGDNVPNVKEGQSIVMDGELLDIRNVIAAELLNVLITAEYLQIEAVMDLCEDKFGRVFIFGVWDTVANSPQLSYPAISVPLFEKICQWIPPVVTVSRFPVCCEVYLTAVPSTKSTSGPIQRQRVTLKLPNNRFLLNLIFSWGSEMDPSVLREVAAKMVPRHFQTPLSIADVKKLAAKHGTKFEDV
ncbi:hypothetical protein DFJ73DRAFT_907851 [Zopfochytrium polystomum]|nr:hypothetical protein DFJ73DRAFT_907851 [Zopfochytrium polystomum]